MALLSFGGCCLLLGWDSDVLWFGVQSMQQLLEVLQSKFSCVCSDPSK